MKKLAQVCFVIFFAVSGFPAWADDLLVNSQDSVSTNNQFITIGVNGWYAADTDVNLGAANYFDQGRLRNVGPATVGYTNISSFMFSDPASSDGKDYVRQLGDFNCNPDDFVRKDSFGASTPISTPETHSQNFISMAKLEWVYRNTSLFMNGLSEPYIAGQDGLNGSQSDKDTAVFIQNLIAYGPQYREFLAVGPGALADQLAVQIASGAINYDQINQTYGSQLKLLPAVESTLQAALGKSGSSLTWNPKSYADLVIALWIRAWEAPNDIRFFSHSMGGTVVMRYLSESYNPATYDPDNPVGLYQRDQTYSYADYQEDLTAVFPSDPSDPHYTGRQVKHGDLFYQPNLAAIRPEINSYWLD